MATDLTEAQQAHDLRAEEKAKEMKTDFNEFVEFVSEDWIHMKSFEEALKCLNAGDWSKEVCDRRKSIGFILADNFNDWCDAKAFEMTGE